MTSQWDAFREDLAVAAATQDPMRALRVLAVLHRAFEAVGYQTPVLVGGAAVEYYTAGGYATEDIDALLYTPHEKVTEVMTGLGFAARGKDWVQEELRIFVEFPGVTSSDANFIEARVLVDGVDVRIERLEYTMVGRLMSFDQGYTADGVAFLLLLERAGDRIDWEVLRRLAEAEGVLPLLERVLEFERGIDWQAPPGADELADRLYRLNHPSASTTMEEEDERDGTGRKAIEG